ncbi:MAG TPA: lamin tail domain-containing protein, partial [Candidatus Paceibacterota bacterium]|nr:lamin tail domain-containing protein [Candidatus Paceibacterota bacterium]
MKTTRQKIAAVLLTAALIALNFPSYTSAYFFDTETSGIATLSAGTLDIEASATSSSMILAPGDDSDFDTSVSDNGSLPFQYGLAPASNSCTASLSSALHISVKEGDADVYSGSIIDAFASTTTLGAATTTLGDWSFKFSLDPSYHSTADESCSLSLAFDAWQTNVPSYGAAGFSDSVAMNFDLSVAANPGVVLNEILPNPEGDDSQHGLQGEWVELYNNGNTPVDLTGWKITDADGHSIPLATTTTWNGRTTIGAKGGGLEWVVVMMNGQILNNDGDTVSLYDADGNLVDSYTYSASVTDGDSDSNNTPDGGNGNPGGSETAGNEGKSYARIPDGTGAWVDPVPTPDMPNELIDPDALLL